MIRENTKEFYDQLYTSGVGLAGYRANNWAIHLQDEIFKIPFESVLDVGCGNGLFLKESVRRGYRAHGVDISSRSLNDADMESIFTCMNVCEDVLPTGFDLVVSTDMMEHLPEEKINFAINNISGSARQMYIVVAMYDDNESHLTIKPVDWWAQEFRRVDERIKLVRTLERKPNKPVAIFQR